MISDKSITSSKNSSAKSNDSSQGPPSKKCTAISNVINDTKYNFEKIDMLRRTILGQAGDIQQQLYMLQHYISDNIHTEENPQRLLMGLLRDYTDCFIVDLSSLMRQLQKDMLVWQTVHEKTLNLSNQVDSNQSLFLVNHQKILAELGVNRDGLLI